MSTAGFAEAPPCQAPLAEVRPPAFAIPDLACDTHAHVIGAPERYRMVPDRSYTPPPASEAAYLNMLGALRMTRGVLVQISVYGTDNRCMLETLHAHPQRLRGVAVVEPEISDADLETLAAAGVCGVRINVLFRGGMPMDALERLAARIAPLGWHVQLLMDARDLTELGDRIARLPVDVVFDHMGHVPVGAGTGHEGFQRLMRLMRDGKAWAKLSGAYRVSAEGAPFHDTLPFARVLAEAAPDRCLWGSDWPHVAVPGPMFDTGDLLDLLPLWVPDAALRQRILVDNPARLYRFPTVTAGRTGGT